MGVLPDNAGQHQKPTMKLQTTLIGPAPRIAVDHAGQGPLLVFLHGIGGQRTNWHAQLQALADRFHVVAWDARGYGASDDYDGPLAFGDFSADLVRVLDHFGAEAAHLVGLSMGGMIAQDFYRRLGFTARGEPFEEVNIPHVEMFTVLPKT